MCLIAAVMLLSLSPLVISFGPTSTPPNIVYFVTDDQDQMLGASFPEHGGVGPMDKTKRLMAQAGATAVNFFIHTPICCARPGTPRNPHRRTP